MSETPSTRRWRALVQSLAASDLSNADFAKAHDLIPSTLGWWRTRLKRSPATPEQGEPRPTITELSVAERAATVVLTLDDPSAGVAVQHVINLALLKRVVPGVA
jgi:transposase-like protein